MNKPDDIAQDIWDAASRLFQDLESPRLDYRDSAKEVAAARIEDIRMISRLIQSERK